MERTEQEAKTKWCPFARVGVGQEGVGINRRNYDKPTVTEQYCCIASACMAWRWQPQGSIDRPMQFGPGNQTVKREIGFCGLAGRPE